jgi:hypothetical protein
MGTFSYTAMPYKPFRDKAGSMEGYSFLFAD